MKKLGLVILWCVIIYIAAGFLGCRERVVSPPGLETATATATAMTMSWDFETAGSLDGWALATDPGFTSAAQTTGTAAVAPYHGAGCAGIGCNFTGGYTLGTFQYVFTQAQNFTGKTITAHVYIPASVAGTNYVVLLFFINGSNFHNSWDPVSGLSAGWNTFTYSPSGVGENVVNKFGIQINQDQAVNVSDPIYVDLVSVQ